MSNEFGYIPESPAQSFGNNKGIFTPTDIYDLTRADTTFQNFGYTNQDNWFGMQVGTSTQEQFNSIHYLYNFNNSSEYSFITNEIVGIDTSATCSGQQGGAVHTVTEANDSIGFLCSAGNITSGTFTLYKVI